MKHIKLKYILAILSALFFAIIFWNFLNILSFTDPGIDFEGKSKQEKLYPNSPIIQKINATENNFSQVNISISKFSPRLGDKITLEVFDESCEKKLDESKINALSWNSSSYSKFGFKTISDSKDKIFCLKFTYTPSGKEQDKKVYISSHPLEGSSYINTGKSIEEQKNQTLELKPAYGNESNWKNFSQLIDRMSQYKPDFLKTNYLITIFFLSFSLILALAAVVIFI